MINKNILEKSVMAKEELDGFYNAQFEPMEFPWLSDVKAWIEKGYDVKIMTILYEFTIDKIHKFTLYFYSYEQHKNIPLVGDNFWEYHCEEIETIISHYLKIEDGTFQNSNWLLPMFSKECLCAIFLHHYKQTQSISIIL